MRKRIALFVLMFLLGFMVVSCASSSTPEPSPLPPTATPVVTVETATPASETSAASGGNSNALPAPDFTLQTLDGESVSLSDYRGKLVMINFWASWCPPCNSEMPDLQSYYEKHKDEDFIILGVNYEDSPDKVQAFVEKYGVTFPILLDSEGQVANLFGIQGLPTSFFVDKEGNVLGYQPGPVTKEMLEDGITPLLQK